MTTDTCKCGHPQGRHARLAGTYAHCIQKNPDAAYGRCGCGMYHPQDDEPAAGPSAPADADLRERIAQAMADNDGWVWAEGFDKTRSPSFQGYLRAADAVLAAAVLREAAAEERLARVTEWVTSDVVTARNEFGNGYREAQRDIRDLLAGRRMADKTAPGA